MAKLGEIATYINGYPFKPEDWSDDGVPIIRIQDLSGNSYQTNRYNGKYAPKYEVNDGDVLISWSASLGVYIWHGEKAVLNQHIFKVVFDKAEVDKSFFVHQVGEILEKATASAHGATMKHLTKPVFDALPFYLPPIEEQRRIAAVLDKVTDLIAQRRAQLDKLDLLVKSRFVEMFGCCNYPHKSLIDLIVEGAGLSYGIVQPGNDGTGDMGVIRPVDLVDGKISIESLKHIDRSIGDAFKKTELTGNELLITVRGTTGITALSNRDCKGMNVTRGIAVVRYDCNKINPVYLNAYLNTDESQNYIQEHTRGATLQQINLSDLRLLHVLIPPMAQQEQFANFIHCTDHLRKAFWQSLNRTEMLRKSLMQQYFEEKSN